MPEVVNPQVTDTITQVDTQVIAEAPAHSMALAYQVLAHSVGHSMQNGANGRQIIQTIAAATAAKSLELIARIGVS